MRHLEEMRHVVEQAKLTRSMFRGFLKDRECLRKIVTALGGAIQCKENESHVMIRIEPDKSFMINLSPYSSPRRDLFTIAHAIGHYLLHTPNLVEQPILYYRQCFDSQKNEAHENNLFACLLLMPRDEYVRVKNERKDEQGIARYFGLHENVIPMRETFLHLGF